MRSTLQIIIAVNEGDPVTLEECRLALAAHSSISHFIESALDDLIESVEEKSVGRAKLDAGFAKGTRERMFQAMKKPPAEWLGPDNIPGSPEKMRRSEEAKRIAQQAGVEL